MAEESEKILKRLLASNKGKYGEEHSRMLGIQLSLASNLLIQERYSEAEVLSRSILTSVKEVLEEGDDTPLFTLGDLSLALIGQEKWAEAEHIMRELITKATTLYGKHHPTLLLFNLTLLTA
jgi:hypothetical protein